jgi:hypothetical protein
VCYVKGASLEGDCVRDCRSLANIKRCPYVNSMFLNGCDIRAIDIIARIVQQATCAAAIQRISWLQTCLIPATILLSNETPFVKFVSF